MSHVPSGNADASSPTEKATNPPQNPIADAATLAPSPTASFETPATPETTAVLPSIPGFEILAELGRGGMGVVYKARQLRLNRLVALKMVLAGGHAGAAELARFHVEAQAVASFQHPHIVQIYEIGELDGRPYVALEYVDGGSLARKLAQGPLAAQEAARITEALARAVHHAHQRGILHRDIKPANVLLHVEIPRPEDTTATLTAGGIAQGAVPKITDFGLAKRLEGPGVTQSGQAILGTPSYMAPEQAEGKPEKIGPATDIYGLGATLYEMLTGRPPYREVTPLETLLKILHEEPAPPSRWRADLPRDLETICQKCLQRQPRQRYATAEALAEDLRRFQSGEPIAARPPTAWERAARWVKRRREKVALALAGVLLAVFVAVVLWPRPPAPNPAPPLDPGQKAPLHLPADLALVPRDSATVCSVKVSEILGREGLYELYKEITKLFPAVPTPEGMAAEIEKNIGIRPADIARLTLVFSGPAQPQAPRPKVPLADFMSLLQEGMEAALLTTVKPHDRAKILACVPGKWAEKRHGERVFFTMDAPNAPALCFIDDRIVIAAMSEAKMRAFLGRIPAADARGALDESLQMAARYPLVIGAIPPRGQGQQRAKEWTKGFAADPSQKVKFTPEGERQLEALLDPQSVTITVDWLLRTAVGDAIKYDLFLTYGDETQAAQARDGAKVAQTSIVAGLNAGRDGIKQLATSKELAKANFDIAAFSSFLEKLVNESTYAAQAAEISLQNRTVTVQMRMRFDILELIRTARALDSQSAATVKAAKIRVQIGNDLRELAVALHEYQRAHKRFPPATIYSAKGQPLYSWRVAILPHLSDKQAKALYAEFKLDEPWDSPHNQKLLAKMPHVFTPRRAEAKETHTTHYQVFVGPGAAFEGKVGKQTRDFLDGTTKTLLVVEAEQAVPWTKPADLSYSASGPLPKLGPSLEEGFVAAFADGSVRAFSGKTSEPDLRALITRNGKEVIDWDKLP
ncbi:MAG: protein kinase [Gemmataceae bacterium]|nr:protein kinase [Gemmataceae bacterium]MCI0741660.1 protein kinase [Gemmataceae bacterium]